MNKEIFNKALQVEELEDRFEMTTFAADANRCGDYDFGIDLDEVIVQ